MHCPAFLRQHFQRKRTKARHDLRQKVLIGITGKEDFAAVELG